MTTPDGETDKHAQAEIRLKACHEEPLVTPSKEEYDLDLTAAGTDKELRAMRDFGVYEEVQFSDADARYYQGALPTMWVKRPRGVPVFYQKTTDKGETYASTPLKLVLLTGLLKGYSFNFYDVRFAFLHSMPS